MLDTTIAWRGMANAGLAYAEPGWAAAKAEAEARKNAAYAAALERQAERFGNGERFVPLSFEISGIWVRGENRALCGGHFSSHHEKIKNAPKCDQWVWGIDWRVRFFLREMYIFENIGKLLYK